MGRRGAAVHAPPDHMDRTGETLNPMTHALAAGVVVALAGSLAQLGIVALIAEGYGTLAWGFLAVYIIPLITIGIWRLFKAEQEIP